MKLQNLTIFSYKRAIPDKGVCNMKDLDINFEKVLELKEIKQMKPVCQVHQRWLFILIPGFKSYAYDFYTQRHIEFPGITLPGK